MKDDLGEGGKPDEGTAAQKRAEGEAIRIEANAPARLSLTIAAGAAGGMAVLLFAWNGTLSSPSLVLLVIFLVTAVAAVTLGSTVAMDDSGEFVERQTRMLGMGFKTKICTIEDIHAVTVTSRRRLSQGAIVNDFASCLVLRAGTAVQISPWHVQAVDFANRQAEAFADAMPRPFVPGKPGFSVLVSRSSDGTFVIERVMHQSTKVRLGGTVFSVSVALLVLAVVMGGAVILQYLDLL